MKLLNWNIGSLNSLCCLKSERAIQSRNVLKKISQQSYDVISFQETKLGPAGPTDKEICYLNKYFPNYQMAWRSSQKPAKLKYSGTMFLYSPRLKPLQIIKPNINNHGLDNEGRLLIMEYRQYFLVNAYIPHYEFHQEKQHQRWLAELIEYFKQINSIKPLVISGDLAILPGSGQRFTKRRPATQKLRAQYHRLLDLGLVDAYRVKPRTTAAATWWAPNIPKQVDQGIRLDYWFVSQAFRSRIIEAGPLNTGKRRDHAPVALTIDL